MFPMAHHSLLYPETSKETHHAHHHIIYRSLSHIYQGIEKEERGSIP
jgi:hypothetical protein